MVSSDSIRGFIDIIVLSCLIKKDMYGYELSKEISDITNKEYEIHEATLYAVLNRLEKKGAILSYEGALTHGRKRKYFKINLLGRSYYNEMIQSYHSTKKVVDKFIGGENENS